MQRILLSGPGKNALSTDLMSDLRERLKAADGAPILLTGADDCFSAGLNLREVAELDADTVGPFLTLLTDTMRDLYYYPGPVVALVNGHAIAGGCFLALCCDLRVAVAADNARIGLNEAALGLRFPPALLSMARHRLPQHHLHKIVLGAGLFNPKEARRLGLVDEVDEDAEQVAGSILRRLSGYERSSYAATKRDLRDGHFAVSERAQREFLEEVMPIWTSAELKERLSNILDRKR